MNVTFTLSEYRTVEASFGDTIVSAKATTP